MKSGHAKLPISAVIPVLNCAHRMREHMEESMEWLSEVEEIIVVDSDSKDNTMEIIRECAGHLNPRILNHPAGLYESWNRGVFEATSPFVYFSTVGDYITLDGLQKLHHSISTLEADIVISPPRFTHESEATSKRTKVTTWPIHKIIRDLNIEHPRLMDASELYDHVMVYLQDCMLGSSASNLYRRSLLIDHPFSGEFRSMGDSAWIIKHNFDAKIAIHPQSFSTFLFHAKDWTYAKADSAGTAKVRRELACMACSKALEQNSSLEPHILTAAERILKSKQIDIMGPNRSLGECVPETLIKAEQPEAKLFLCKINSILLEIDMLDLRMIEHTYRSKLGHLRYLWPPLIRARRKRKNLERQIRRFRTQSRVPSTPTYEPSPQPTHP